MTLLMLNWRVSESSGPRRLLEPWVVSGCDVRLTTDIFSARDHQSVKTVGFDHTLVSTAAVSIQKTFDSRMLTYCAMPYTVCVCVCVCVCVSWHRRLADCNLTPELLGVGFKLFMFGFCWTRRFSYSQLDFCSQMNQKQKRVLTWFHFSLFTVLFFYFFLPQML